MPYQMFRSPPLLPAVCLVLASTGATDTLIAAPQFYFSHAAAFAGDFDADGATDVVVGSPGEGEGTGMVHVYSGPTGKSLLDLAGPRGEDDFGCAVAALSDLDGDGRSELAIGCTPFWPPGPGCVYVHSGATGKLLYTLEPQTDPDDFGRSCVVVPATETERREHLLVYRRLPGDRPDELTPAFACYEVGTWQLLWLARTPSTSRAAHGGDFATIALAGNLDGDRIEDFLVQFVDDTPQTRLRALAGRDGSTLWEILEDRELGHIVSFTSLCDRNDDSADDVLVSRYREATSKSDAPSWSLCLHSGRNGALMEKRDSSVAAGKKPWDSPCGSLASFKPPGGQVPIVACHACALEQQSHTTIFNFTSGDVLLEFPDVSSFDFSDASAQTLLAGGDANADGTPDLVVQVYCTTSLGFPEQGVYVYSGRDGSELFRKTYESEFGGH
jgi:hypothetical protein